MKYLFKSGFLIYVRMAKTSLLLAYLEQVRYLGKLRSDHNFTVRFIFQMIVKVTMLILSIPELTQLHHLRGNFTQRAYFLDDLSDITQLLLFLIENDGPVPTPCIVVLALINGRVVNAEEYLNQLSIRKH